ncbi:surfeit locus protein 6 homolog isoform X2 [Acipenser ruthenus]|nr:surfeit locus protein 6 homolog isoform X2 [Acipenser ruthenus]XP_058861496.1 surfeit locus protein 6 homolog isoform X2 [Acipenser ruthenus]
MTSLAAKDAYLQKLGSKVCAAQKLQLRKRPFVPYRGGEAGQPKTKKKSRQKPPGGKKYDRQGKLPPAAAADATALKTGEKVPIKAAQNRDPKPVQSGDAKPLENGTPVKGVKAAPSSFFTVDILRQRLHEKIEETRGHGNAKGLSAEELERKRSRRKQERDRKKRKRKEIRRKQLAEKEAGEIKAEEEEKEEKEPQNRVGTAKPESTLVFNKVDVGDEIASKTLQKKQKKKSVKGNLTPLIGKNYKQLLSRVEARKAKLEELRGKDEGKAKEMEEKIKWTNVLYKAEGLKIKDNEELLRASLKRKEKSQAAKKKRWGERSEHVLEKMQHRQDKRRRNIQKQKHSKSEKRKDKARKKGRVLPEDLKKAI